MIERHEAYSYHVTFNAMHNLVLDDPTKMHAHTFRVGMYVIEKQDEHPVFLNNEMIKFEAVVGNPPYQEISSEEENKTEFDK